MGAGLRSCPGGLGGLQDDPPDPGRLRDVEDGPRVQVLTGTGTGLVEAAIDAHALNFQAMTASLDLRTGPRDRLKALLRGWAEQRELTARYGCPTGTLCSELDKRTDGLDRAAAEVMRLLIDYAELQFRSMGRADSRELAIALVSAYQGISLLTNTFRDPELMTGECRRLERWIDSLA
ncbi:TetR/AcrR family transcriptional regulator [Streptosporangium sp. NPDC002721]|uniref:LmrA/YxaF family transcription factor n=1 Tax=Streptosporangium sp. NPDC002721 TaxID=3366188 RepID=UPI0036D0A5B8